MTTIAYKDGIMATDSRATAGSKIIRGSLEKIFHTEGAVVGVVGDADHHIVMSPDFKTLRSPKDFPEWISNLEKEEADWGIIAVFHDDPETVWIGDVTCDGDTSKSYFYDTHLKPGEGIARGSGTPWAEAAMVLGMGAEEAVEFTKQFDAATGGDVVAYDV